MKKHYEKYLHDLFPRVYYLRVNSLEIYNVLKLYNNNKRIMIM